MDEPTLSERLQRLNDADLSGLMGRIKTAKAELEKEIKLKADDPNRVVTTNEVRQIAASAGITVEEFMDALETAKRMGLL